jgi:hypothetical protein
MPENESLALGEYIDDVMRATLEGKMVWTAVNPSTYSFISGDRAGRFVLQRVDRMVKQVVHEGNLNLSKQVKEIGYVFQVFNLSTLGGNIQPFVTIDSFENPAMNPKLEALMKVIEVDTSKRKLDFLRSMVPK